MPTLQLWVKLTAIIYFFFLKDGALNWNSTSMRCASLKYVALHKRSAGTLTRRSNKYLLQLILPTFNMKLLVIKNIKHFIRLNQHYCEIRKFV